MTKVVIIVDGGNVQEVLTDDSSLEISLVDYDNFPNVEMPAWSSALEPVAVLEIGEE